MQDELIDFVNCKPAIADTYVVAGINANRCQVLEGSAGSYTNLCSVPRRIGEARLSDIQRYCEDLSRPAYERILTSPSFSMAVFATIALYVFLRYLVSLASKTSAEISDETLKPPSKRDLRFPRL
jgi:hypothetical protein